MKYPQGGGGGGVTVMCVDEYAEALETMSIIHSVHLPAMLSRANAHRLYPDDIVVTDL